MGQVVNCQCLDSAVKGARGEKANSPAELVKVVGVAVDAKSTDVVSAAG